MLSTTESSGVARDRDAEPQHPQHSNFEVAFTSETDDVTPTCPAESLGSVSTAVLTQSSIPCISAGLVKLNLSSQPREVNDKRSADSLKIKCGRSSRRSFIHPSPPATYMSEIGRSPATLPSTCDPFNGVQLAPYLPGIRRKSFIFGEYSPSTINISDEMKGSGYPFPSDLSEDLDQEVTLQRAKLPKVLHRRERDCVRFVRPSSARRTPLSLRCLQTTSIGNLGKALPASLPFPLCQKVDTMDLVEHFHHPYVTVPLRSISMSSPVPKLKPLSSVVPSCFYHGSDIYPARLDFQSILPSPRSRSSSPFKALSLSCATLNTAIQHTQRPSKTFLPLPVTDTKVCQADGGLRTPCSVCALTSITTSPETTPRLSSETKTSGLAMLHSKLEPVSSTCSLLIIEDPLTHTQSPGRNICLSPLYGSAAESSIPSPVCVSMTASSFYFPTISSSSFTKSTDPWSE